ncbi:glycosyltransferase family 1 protein [uncultured Dokdonia sp.]|uniref:glycosyltransferase family 4 protein n=1 Tax=uncultured Dokdonia sp. TaxID=575653 RepID=UPI002602E43C|nr:glycosyltransferase family 1 protein [uncultured Dokdonia sp.]
MKPSISIAIFAAMSNQSSIFLESHNLKNEFSGFGQFNKHLIDALIRQNSNNFQFVIHARDKNKWSEHFGQNVAIKKYYNFTRNKSIGIRKRFDVWHSLNQNTKIEPLRDLPYVLTVHDVNFIDEISSDLNHKRNKRFQEKLDRATAITYISTFAKQSTHRYFKVPEVPEYIIYNGNTIKEVEISDTYTPEISPSRPFLFTIGDVCERKNQHALVKMLKYLNGFDLVISGKMASEYAQGKLKATIKDLGLENRVHLTGRISDLDKFYYYKNCEAFMFPTLREGFGIPAIEAMRFGKPAFISNNTSLPEVGGDVAFYWDHYDAKYMAEIVTSGLAEVAHNKSAFQEKSITHSKKFCWDEAARQYINVYREVLNK